MLSNTTYFYKVTAVNSYGESNPSDIVSATTPPDAPLAPIGLSATGGGGQVVLSWTASTGATSYTLYRGTTSGGEAATPFQSGVTGTSFTDASGMGGTKYFYQVRGVNAGGTSTPSAESAADPAGTPYVFNQNDWIVLDQYGAPVTVQNGGFPLSGTMTGSDSESYPGLLALALSKPLSEQDYYVSAYFPNELRPGTFYGKNDGASVVASGGFSITADIGNADVQNGVPHGDVGTADAPLPVNGGLNVSASGTLTQTWKWVGSAPPNAQPMPLFLDLLVSAPIDVSLAPDYGSSGLSSGLTGTVSASNGMGDTISLTIPCPPRLSLPGKHLVRYPVDKATGKVTVTVTGQVKSSVVDQVPFGTYVYVPPSSQSSGSYQYQSTNGMTIIWSDAHILATAQQAGPPKSILINRPENSGPNIEGDRNIFNYDSGEWTSYGDSRFNNDWIDQFHLHTAFADTVDLTPEQWVANLLGSPWPPEATMVSDFSSTLGDWRRDWHWYAEDGNTQPPTGLGNNQNFTFSIFSFDANALRPHVNWPHFPDTGTPPRDLLERVDSPRFPPSVQRRVNLHLTDSSVKESDRANPLYNFNHHANFFITYHNEFELDGATVTSAVPYADNPWKLYRSPVDNSTLQEDGGTGPSPRHWAPGSVSQYIENAYGVSLDLPLSPDYTRNYGTSITQNIGDTDIPVGMIGVVYYRQPKVRYAFNMKHFLPGGRHIRGYDANGKELPWRFAVDRPNAGFDDHAMVTRVQFFPQGAIPPDTLATESGQ